jgi:hypothetical protein
MSIREQDTKTVTTAGVPERLVDVEILPLATRLVVTAISSNTDSIYVGNYDTLASATKGHKLDALNNVGAEFVFPRQQPFDIWVDSIVNGEGVHWALHDD